MGQIKILDTGFIKPTNAGTQYSSANRANAGLIIGLKTTEFTPSLTRNISNNPTLNNNGASPVHLGSMENMKFSLRCILNTSKTGLQEDMNIIYGLIDMVRTNGYKLMWYDFSAAAEDNNGQLIYQLARNPVYGHQLTAGEQTEFGITSSFYHLHVLFNDAQYRHTAAKGTVMYEFKGIVLPVEESGI